MKRHKKHRRHRPAKGIGAMKILGLSVPALLIGGVAGVMLVKKGVV
jgi:hypothetical protein